MKEKIQQLHPLLYDSPKINTSRLGVVKNTIKRVQGTHRATNTQNIPTAKRVSTLKGGWNMHNFT
jgi:hypothetical protein